MSSERFIIYKDNNNFKIINNFLKLASDILYNALYLSLDTEATCAKEFEYLSSTRKGISSNCLENNFEKILIKLQNKIVEDIYFQIVKGTEKNILLEVFNKDPSNNIITLNDTNKYESDNIKIIQTGLNENEINVHNKILSWINNNISINSQSIKQQFFMIFNILVISNIPNVNKDTLILIDDICNIMIFTLQFRSKITSIFENFCNELDINIDKQTEPIINPKEYNVRIAIVDNNQNVIDMTNNPITLNSSNSITTEKIEKNNTSNNNRNVSNSNNKSCKTCGIDSKSSEYNNSSKNTSNTSNTTNTNIIQEQNKSSSNSYILYFVICCICCVIFIVLILIILKSTKKNKNKNNKK